MNVSGILTLALAFLTVTHAASAPDAPKPYVGSAEFEKIKTRAAHLGA